MQSAEHLARHAAGRKHERQGCDAYALCSAEWDVGPQCGKGFLEAGRAVDDGEFRRLQAALPYSWAAQEETIGLSS